MSEKKSPFPFFLVLTQEFEARTHMESLMAPQHTSVKTDSISHFQEAQLRNYPVSPPQFVTSDRSARQRTTANAPGS